MVEVEVVRVLRAEALNVSRGGGGGDCGSALAMRGRRVERKGSRDCTERTRELMDLPHCQLPNDCTGERGREEGEEQAEEADEGDVEGERGKGGAAAEGEAEREGEEEKEEAEEESTSEKAKEGRGRGRWGAHLGGPSRGEGEGGVEGEEGEKKGEGEASEPGGGGGRLLLAPLHPCLPPPRSWPPSVPDTPP